MDFDDLELRVTRSTLHKKIEDRKTEASAKPVPLDRYLAEDLRQPDSEGQRPYWPDNLMKARL